MNAQCNHRPESGANPCMKPASWADEIPLPGGGYATVFLCKMHSDRHWKARKNLEGA